MIISNSDDYRVNVAYSDTTSDSNVSEDESDLDTDDVTAIERSGGSRNSKRKKTCWFYKDESTIVDKSSEFVKCQEYSNSLTGNICISFPFQAFELRKLNFTIDLLDCKFHDRKCAENYYKCEEISKINIECSNLKYNSDLNRIVNQVDNPNKYFNYQYLNYPGFCDRLHLYTKRIDEYRLQNLNKDFLIISLKNKLSLYKRFNFLLANNDVERIRELMSVCLKNKMGIKGIINKLIMSINGVYEPKGWKKNDIDLGNFF